MHAVLINQTADILHLNDKMYYEMSRVKKQLSGKRSIRIPLCYNSNVETIPQENYLPGILQPIQIIIFKNLQGTRNISNNLANNRKVTNDSPPLLRDSSFLKLDHVLRRIKVFI